VKQGKQAKSYQQTLQIQKGMLTLKAGKKKEDLKEQLQTAVVLVVYLLQQSWIAL
jgi:hypothetical protein